MFRTAHIIKMAREPPEIAKLIKCKENYSLTERFAGLFSIKSFKWNMSFLTSKIKTGKITEKVPNDLVTLREAVLFS